jgi:hypothetical protein
MTSKQDSLSACYAMLDRILRESLAAEELWIAFLVKAARQEVANSISARAHDVLTKRPRRPSGSFRSPASFCGSSGGSGMSRLN